MTSEAAASAPERLLTALAAARSAFESGDAIAASAALDGVVAACGELEAAGVRLGRDTLERARALHQGCAAAALPLRQELSAKLQQAAGAKRAATAYAR